MQNRLEKKYGERQIARILIINALRGSLQMEEIAALLRYVNGSAEEKNDDIIGEGLLFDYFCNCIAALNLESGGFTAPDP